LFNYLASDSNVVELSKIKGIIENFNLPISFDEFFNPIGKKDKLNYSEFCELFKGNKKETMNPKKITNTDFLKSFYNINISDENEKEEMENMDNMFPVQTNNNFTSI
jgi:hypothetical protein